MWLVPIVSPLVLTPWLIKSIYQPLCKEVQAVGFEHAATYACPATEHAITCAWLLVVCRFLDAQRIHNLTSYLEQLHSSGLASADHTTLLLNCYTKLKDVAKLDAFIARDRDQGSTSTSASASLGTGVTLGSSSGGGCGKGGRAGGGGGPGVGFDMETAYKVLRSAGYYSHALWVAERAGQVEWRLDVWLEDMQEYDEALRFIGE